MVGGFRAQMPLRHCVNATGCVALQRHAVFYAGSDKRGIAADFPVGTPPEQGLQLGPARIPLPDFGLGPLACIIDWARSKL